MRFEVLKVFFVNFKSDHITLEQAKANLQAQPHRFSEKDKAKFVSLYPDLNIDEFTQFTRDCGVYVVPKTQAPKGESGEIANAIASPEKAAEIGVLPENVDAWIAKVKEVKALLKELQAITPGGTVSFAIPLKKVRTKATEVPEQPAE